MKVLSLLVLLCILGVYAQRRSANLDSTNLDTSSQRPASRSRGRTRFSITPEFEEVSAEYEEVTKHTRKTDVPRRKSENVKPVEKRLPRPAKESGTKSRTYEVKEVVDDVPREDSRRVNKKSRVITETRFEAANAAKKDLFTPASPAPEELPPNLSSFPTPAVPESIAEETALPAQLTTIPINAISSTEKLTEGSPESLDISSSSEIPKLDTELKRKQPEATTSSAKPPESRRVPHARAGARTRGTTSHRVEEQTTPVSRVRTRTKSSRKSEDPSSVVSSAPSTRSNFRPGRRRGEAVAESIQEPVKTRGPSVFAAESTQELPPRLRTGRKVSSASERRNEQRNRSEENRKTGRSRGERINDTQKQIVTTTPEKIDLHLNRRGDTRRAGRFTEPSTEGADITRSAKDIPTPTTSSAPERVDLNLNRRVDARRGGRFTEPSTERSESTPNNKDTLAQTPSNAPEKVDLNLSRRIDTRKGRFTEPSTERSENTPSNKDILAQTPSNAPEKVDLNLSRRIDTRKGRFTEPSIERSESTPSNKDILVQTPNNAPEKVDLNLNRRIDTRKGRITEPSTEGSVTSRNSNKAKNVNEPVTRSQRRGVTRTTTQINIESTTQHIERQSRVRGRSRSFLTLNEQKLEVLPLFENEPKTVPQNYDLVTVSSRSSLGRRRSLNSAEDIAAANTKQTEIKVEVDPINEELETGTQSNIRISREESISVDTNTEKAIRKIYKKRPTFQRSKQPRKLHRALAESKEETTEAVFIRKFRPTNSRKNVVGHSSKKEVAVNDENEKAPNDVKEKTANKAQDKSAKEEKKKINENEDTKQTVKVDEPKVSIREVVRKVSQKLPSTKGKEKVSAELSTTEDSIAEGDNYPAPYKAAIRAKKGKKEGLGSRSTQLNELSVTKTTETSATPSSASGSLDSSSSSEAPVSENAVNQDEEIDRKSESESTTIAPSTKFPRPRFSLTTKQPRSTENSSESTNKNAPNRPVVSPRKYKPSKPKPAVTTTTQSSTGEENEASLTTTPTPLQKFHARFKSSRNQKDKGTEVHITPRTAHKSRSYSPKAPKGLYSSKKLSKTTIAPDVSEETEKPKPPKFSVETSALPTKVPPVGHTIKKSSRFSARYRSDILSRSAAHRTSTAGPTYIPTVPTVTPPPTSVKVEENELGMEIISFDDPVANTVPSANLISGDYLSSSPSTKTDPTVESKGAAAHTTEKPVSIIERIINSISSISTTSSPDGTTKTATTTSGQPTKSSAIQNLVSKKPKDKTVTIELPLESGAQKLTNLPNSVEYRTTEKPTTIIEKILSSLSAIRADTAPETTTVDPLQVGSNYNTVDTTVILSSTESTSRIAKATIPMSKGSSATALPLISESTIVLPTSTASSSSTSGSTTLESHTSNTVLPFDDISTIPLGTSSITSRSIPSTTPLSSQATSTTLDPTNVFEEIVSDQILPKRTIDKLLSLLNIVTPTTTTPLPTTTKLVVVTPKLTTFVTSNTEPINTEQNATPVPTTLPTTLDASSTIASSSPETTTPMLFTSTLRSSPETSSDDINLIANPLSSSEPTVGSRFLEMFSTLSRIMASTLSPSTTISPTSAFTSEGTSTVNLPNTTPGVSRVTTDSTGTSTTFGNSGSTTAAGTSTVNLLNTTPGVSTVSADSTATSTTIGNSGSTTAAGTSTVNLPNTTPGISTVTVGSTGTSTIIGSSGSTTSEVPEMSTPSTVPTISTTTISITTSAATGTSATSTTPTTTVASGAVTTPAEALITSIAAANPLAITTPIITVTDSATVSVATQTNLPTSSTATTQTSPAASSTIESFATNPSTVGTFTTGIPTTPQGSTSTEVSVAQGSEVNVPSVTPNLITSTLTSNTQTASTLLTTVNTTPSLTSTTGSAVTMSTTQPQTEATSISTGTTGSSIITSTTKFTRETTTDSTFDVPTTLPTLANFEVSPDRVSVYSANDISSTFVPDDPVSTTISISARAFVPGTTLNTVAEATTSSPVTTTQNVIPTSQPTVGTTGASSTVTATTLSTSVGSTTTAIPTSASATANSISSSIATAVPLANNVISGSTVTPSTSPPLITTINSVKSASNSVDATTQDVSSNTIDTSSVTDKQSLVNQTEVSNLVNPLSAGTNVSVADNSSMSSGLFVSPSLPDNNTPTINTRYSMMEFMTRDGKLLRLEPNALQNNIQSTTRNKDYFIFAVLPNNTILRKRPSMYPTKETPFLIYGVLPNNTLIQKFPNGTIVPMEPVIQVIGFDTRENPPPPPEIISNQVTPDQESRPDNNKISTGGRNSVPSIQVNQLSLNSDSSSTASTLPPLTEILGGRTVIAFNSIVNQTQGEVQMAKVQTLEVDPLTNRVRLDKVVHLGNMIFRWKPVTSPNFTPVVPQVQSRLNVENVEINTISSASSSPPPPPTSAPSSSTTKAVTTTTASPLPATPPPGPPSTEAPFTTPIPLTTAIPIVTTHVASTSPRITTRSPAITILPSTNPPGPPATNPTTQTPTTAIPSTTFLPTLLTTLLSTLQPQRGIPTILPTTISTTAPPDATTVSAIPLEATTILAPVITTLNVPFTSPLPRASAATPNPLSAIPDIDIGDSPKVSTTIVPSPTLMDLLSNGAKISSTPLSATILSTTLSSLEDINLKQKQLTEQQKKDLETLQALEKEQEAILKQLAFLTGLNLGDASPPKNNDNLADRVIAKAMERVKGSSSTNSPPALNLLETLSPKDSRQTKSIAVAPSVEELVKQINANGLNNVTPPGPIVTSTYGKTNDALLASLLKEYGVGPSTPKVLSGAYDKELQSTTQAPKVTTTKRSVTTQAPGRIMQGLNWLLNALAPKPPPKPAQTKTRPKPKSANDDELLSKQPTEVTPVVVASPDQPPEESKTENNVISQSQLLALVKQLEEIQKDPRKAKDLDIEALKALQNIESSQKSGIQVISASATGATSRTFVTTGAPKISSTKSVERAAKYTTPLPLSVSNSILEDIGSTSGDKSTIAPVDLKVVPGVAADLEAATTKTKIPPVKLNPVPGVPEGNPRIRGQLVNYAINVTKAISTFLGSAIQGAANSFQSMIGTGSRMAGNYRNSDSSNRPG